MVLDARNPVLQPSKFQADLLEHPNQMLKLMDKKVFTILHSKFLFLFVCFDSLQTSQQFFNHVRTGLPGSNQY